MQGPPQELLPLVAKLKVAHKQVFYAYLAENHYLFRGLTLGEFKAFDMMSDYDAIAAEDFVIRATLLSPDSIIEDEVLAGVPETLVKFIISTSGFSDDVSLPAILHECRLDIAGGEFKDGSERPPLADRKMVGLVCKAFPRMLPKEVEQMNIMDLCEHIALAEFMTGDQLEVLTREEREALAKKSKGQTGHDIVQQTLKEKGRVDFGRENAGIKKMLEGED